MKLCCDWKSHRKIINTNNNASYLVQSQILSTFPPSTSGVIIALKSKCTSTKKLNQKSTYIRIIYKILIMAADLTTIERVYFYYSKPPRWHSRIMAQIQAHVLIVPRGLIIFVPSLRLIFRKQMWRIAEMVALKLKYTSRNKSTDSGLILAIYASRSRNLCSFPSVNIRKTSLEKR